MSSIKSILMSRDNLSESEAVALIEDVKQEVMALIADGFFEDAIYVMEHELGLEVDYIFQLV